MNKKTVLVLCIVLFLAFQAFTTNAQSSFKGIIPMVTTKAEVEKKFGKRDKYGRYEFEEGTVSILYRETECEKSDNNCFCFVAIGTVLQVEVSPSSEIKVADLNLDPNEWESGEVKGHVEDLMFYSNPKTGVRYYAYRGIVNEIIYDAPSETCKKHSQKAKVPGN